MTPTACSILRHPTVNRYVGDLVAQRCLACDCIWFPAPTPAAATSAPRRVAPLRTWAPGAYVGGRESG